MTLSTKDYALLSDAAYKDPEVKAQAPDGRVISYKRVTLDGVEYRPIAHADNPKAGFQATAYERLDSTHEVLIAYRGTEMDREFKNRPIAASRVSRRPARYGTFGSDS